MVNRFILNEVSYFGPGARKELPGVIARLGFKKAMIVTDKGLIQFGVAKMVSDVLDEAGIPYEIYSEVKPPRPGLSSGLLPGGWAASL